MKYDFPDLSSTGQIPTAGRKILRFHLIKMKKNEKGTKQGYDAIPLHDMRVAIRRMRVAMNFFGKYYDPNIVIAIDGGLRKSGKVLGRVRDWDVIKQIIDHDFASTSQNYSSEERYFYQTLRNVLVRDRFKAREKMLKYLNGKKFKDLKRVLSNLVLNSRDDDHEVYPQKSLTEFMSETIAISLQNVISYNKYFPKISPKQLHELRITIKQLRYVIEFYQCTSGSEVINCIDKLKEAQNILGDINDTRVLVNKLQTFIDEIGNDVDQLPPDQRRYQMLLQSNYLMNKNATLGMDIISFSNVWGNIFNDEFTKNMVTALSSSTKSINYMEGKHENVTSITSW